MGIANTSTSALWMYYLTDLPLEECVGRGSGLDYEGVQHKLAILRQAVDNYRGPVDAEAILRYFGGYEMVVTVGAMLRAAERRVAFLVDGFIMTACLLMARALYPAVTDYAFYGHAGMRRARSSPTLPRGRSHPALRHASWRRDGGYLRLPYTRFGSTDAP